MDALTRDWEINLHFDFVTHLPSKISFCIESRHRPATPKDVTPLYCGELIPADKLAAMTAQATDMWNWAKFGREAA